MNFKENESAQKLRGGYYTSLDLANYLSKWVAETHPKSILEPSCGNGIFLEALSPLISDGTSITAIELEHQEALQASERIRGLNKLSANILCADFLEWYLDEDQNHDRFDAVVGNPPFIRYQYLTEQEQDFSERIFKRHHLPFTKHTNAWVPFVIASLSLLRPGGRMAMVLPAEILHVLHAQALRYFLGQHCKRITIIDPEEIWFEGTLQGAILFLAEKKHDVKEHTVGLGIIQTTGNAFLDTSPSDYFEKTNFVNGKTVEGKWTRALLTRKELEVLDGIASTPSVHRFSDIANVDVGLVTGANKFFLVDDDTVKKHGLAEWSHPMFGRSEHCPGILYDDKQHQENARLGLPSNFLWFDVEDTAELPENVLEYIRFGERENLHTRYKCRIRKPWFKVPSVYATSIGMLKRAHDMPRLIYNDVEAYTTDTAYRITSYKVPAKKFVYCFINSLTALSSELEGRHYGGGVLELVPSEIECLYVPLPNKIQIAIKSLDAMIRNVQTKDVLICQDNKILGELGLSSNEMTCIHDSWDKLRKRRQRSTSRSSQ
ncbi:MAG: N-6 DNA methylase [Nitrospira sp.]|nr:N-6 DNA methylase [Nitrospira sp.]